MADPNMSSPGLSSKDFSSFSASQTTVETQAAKNETSKRIRIVELITATEEHLSTSNSIIQNATTVADTFKITKQVVNTLLAPAKDLVDLLSAVSDIHPAIGVVASVFKAIIKLEMDRQENDRQIAVLYNSMSNMLVSLAYMDDIFKRKDGLRELLDKKLEEIVNLINEFGNLCDVYYKHRSIVRFLRSAKYKEKLAAFAQSFADMKQELESLFSQRTTMTVHKTADAVDDMVANVSQLVAFMEIQTNREREAEAIMTAKGGLEAVLKDDKLLAEVAQRLGDQVNSAVQYTLRQDLNQQLKDNYLLFNIKIQAVQEQITETINRSTMTIIMNLEAGPHEFIHDPDIKAIWKGMKWRHTVKCRNFVSAVHHHFEQMFIRHTQQHGSPHPDMWTLNYMSRVIFYPAIGDAIDEDSSGYVSLHELNHFFDGRPQGWTIPQWIAYWAAGWYRDNLRYRDKIMSRLQFLESDMDTMRSENTEVFREFIMSIKGGIRLVVESLYDDILDYFEDDSAETTELDALREKFTQLTTKQVEEQLAKSKFELDDKRMLMLVIGNSRLESRLFCVMHRLLKRHHKVFDIGRDKPLQAGATVAMTTSWQVVFDAFIKRMRSLTESWRQQRIDIPLQAQWYANGLFEDWYKADQAVPEIEEDYGEYLSDNDDARTEQDENELVEYATRPSTAPENEVGSAEFYDGNENKMDNGDGENDDSAHQERERSPTIGEHHEPELDDDSNRSLNEFKDAQISHIPVDLHELGNRMSKLEGKVDDLKDLMTQILQRLSNA